MEEHISIETTAESEFESVGPLVNAEEFKQQFFQDAGRAKLKMIVLCPFVGDEYGHVLKRLGEAAARGVRILIYMRPADLRSKPRRHEAFIEYAKKLGIQIDLTRTQMHEKAAIIDDLIVWEGSCNLFAHKDSTESMRRLVGHRFALEHMSVNGLPSLGEVKTFNALPMVRESSAWGEGQTA